MGVPYMGEGWPAMIQPTHLKNICTQVKLDHFPQKKYQGAFVKKSKSTATTYSFPVG